MNKKQYLAKRQNLMNEVQKLIDEGKATEAEEKMNEVTALDEEWDKIAQAQANFDALNKEPVAVNPFHYEGEMENSEPKTNTVEDLMKSESYTNAWAKTLMGRPLSNEETQAFKMVNEAFTHNTDNTQAVIPTTVTKGIWEMAGEIYPYFKDVAKTYVNGVLTILQEDTSTDAKWYEEATPTEDGKETFKKFTLNGCELARSITVSWKLKEMAIEDFIPYIQRKLAKKMGAACGYGAVYGQGAKESNAPEPTGVITALLAEDATPQVVTYTKDGSPTYANIIATRAKIKSGYAAGLKIYANSTTIWNKLAGIVDGNKRPLFIPDPTGSGGFRIFGMEIKEDDSLKDGDILFSNPAAGYHMNVNKEVSMMTEDHVKERTTDYCGYAIIDGNVITTKAHALLQEAKS